MRMEEKIKKLCQNGAKRINDAHALQLYYLDELARFLVYGCDDREDFMLKYADIRQSFASDVGTYSAFDACDVALLCEAICRYYCERGRKIEITDFFESAESPSDGSSGTKVAYVRNAMSDEAYRIFEKALENASVVYNPSFASACEEVYYGRVRYCILPYETSDEGTLSGFTRMMRKYELYPKCVCSVRSERGSTKFVLLGRSAYEVSLAKNAKKYLKVSVDSPELHTFAALSAAATALRLKMVKSESVPVSWDDGRYGEAFTFEVENEDDLVPFLLYLSLEIYECSDKAIYSDLK